MLQIRPVGGGMPYAPDRDLVNVFPYVARQAVHLLNDTCWEDWFGDFINKSGLTNDDLCEAAKCSAKFINLTTNPDIDSAFACAKEAGFADLPQPAQMAIMFRFGQVLWATYWSMCRDAMAARAQPPRYEELAPAIEAFCKSTKEAEKPKTLSLAKHCCQEDSPPIVA